MTQFFALREDMLPVLAKIESNGPLGYALADRFLQPHYPTYSSGAEIPNLGIASAASAVGCDRYLVYETSTKLLLRTVTETDRDNRPIRTSYRLDQLHNPDTIVFQPGGVWKGDTLLHGSVSTVPWSNEATKKIRARFQYAIRKHFASIRGYYVAPGAMEMLKAGKRLTIAVQSPHDFDLVLP
jgi:hypothetical protein